VLREKLGRKRVRRIDAQLRGLAAKGNVSEHQITGHEWALQNRPTCLLGRRCR
jgi:hypothetical protein